MLSFSSSSRYFFYQHQADMRKGFDGLSGLVYPTGYACRRVVQTIEYTRVKKASSTQKVSTGRMKLPASLPREQVLIEPAEDVSGWTRIGEEITEELEPYSRKIVCSSICSP